MQLHLVLGLPLGEQAVGGGHPFHHGLLGLGEQVAHIRLLPLGLGMHHHHHHQKHCPITTCYIITTTTSMHQDFQFFSIWFSPLHNVYIVQYVFLPTEQSETYFKNFILTYDLTYICPGLFDWKENTFFSFL